MIIERDGKVILSFGDWTPEMMALSARLHTLPERPSQPYRYHGAIERGVDRLSKLKGPYRLGLNLLHECFDQLEYCPSEDGIVSLGKRLVDMRLELERLQRSRSQSGKSARKQTLNKTAPRQAYSFKRGAPIPGTKQPRPRTRHAAFADACLVKGKWNDKETQFLKDIQGFKTMSEKQRAWLVSLCDRVGIDYADPRSLYIHSP